MVAVKRHLQGMSKKSLVSFNLPVKCVGALYQAMSELVRCSEENYLNREKFWSLRNGEEELKCLQVSEDGYYQLRKYVFDVFPKTIYKVIHITIIPSYNIS